MPQQEWDVPPQPVPGLQPMPTPQPMPQAAPEYQYQGPTYDESVRNVPQPQHPRTMDPSYQQSQVAEQGYLGDSDEYRGGSAGNLEVPSRMASQRAPRSRELGSISGAMAFLTEALARGHADPNSPSKHHPVKLSTQAAVRELGAKLTQEAAQDDRSGRATSSASRHRPSHSLRMGGLTGRNNHSRHSSVNQAAAHLGSIGSSAADVNKALPPVTPAREVHRRHSMTSTEAPGHGRRPMSRASTMRVHQRSATQGSIDMDGRYPKMSTGDGERVAHVP